MILLTSASFALEATESVNIQRVQLEPLTCGILQFIIAMWRIAQPLTLNCCLSTFRQGHSNTQQQLIRSGRSVNSWCVFNRYRSST
ncbi:hypothetical protein KOR42_12180 [Thalassoglobus neptunius]|uniref:Uncharacterized protein n=1 Tax=Thalassoglobus neptunius TaxID=1938619 RepID=A0A5C5X687_9PLAN|nr:hypothetical protein KOR42_12180 [Thalassoglobus neptunius]